MPPGRLAYPCVSIVLTEPPPPEPSIMRISGRRNSPAIFSGMKYLPLIEASADPPRTVKSSPKITTGRPSIVPRPNTPLAGMKSIMVLPVSSYFALPAIDPISRKEPASRHWSIRSRTVSRPP